MDTFTSVLSPHDRQYVENRRKMLDAHSNLSSIQLDRQVQYLMNSAERPSDASGSITENVMHELRGASYIPERLKAILDSSGGGTSGGSVMIRQDLEIPLYLLFVQKFPLFDALRHAPSNGLVHAANQVTAIDGNALGSSVLSSELGSVSYASSTYNRVTFPIAVFATGRGVSFKELAAVQAGGAAYNPAQTEMTNGMLRMATDVQYYMFQGNASTSSGAGASTELGAYNAAGIDGLRSVLGSQGTFSGNNAIQADAGVMDVTNSIQWAAAKAAMNGGDPNLGVLSINAKQGYDQEHQGQQRYPDDTGEIIPGVQVSRMKWANGFIDLLPVPGNTLGTYTRASDSATVEDIYVLDRNTLTVRWLYADNFTVLQIPSGVDGQLSSRWIIFGMFGLEIAAPLFCAKVRRLAS